MKYNNCTIYTFKDFRTGLIFKSTVEYINTLENYIRTKLSLERTVWFTEIYHFLGVKKINHTGIYLDVDDLTDFSMDVGNCNSKNIDMILYIQPF